MTLAIPKGHSTVCQILLGADDSLAEWAEHLSKMGGNMEIKFNPTQVREVMVHPVVRWKEKAEML